MCNSPKCGDVGQGHREFPVENAKSSAKEKIPENSLSPKALNSAHSNTISTQTINIYWKQLR